MKNEVIAKLLMALTLIFTLTLFESCQDLPEASQTGAGTFGMLLNGSQWRGDGAISINPSSIASYDPTSKGFKISCVVNRLNGTQEKFDLIINDLMTPGKYIFGNFRSPKSSYDSTRFWYDDNQVNAFKVKDGLTNSVDISKFDFAKKIVSGTFNVDLENKKSEIIKVTNGRFDLQFTVID